MVWFLIHWAVITLVMLGLVRLMPGVEAANTCVLVVGTVFLGAIAASIRPIMTLASWPRAPLAYGVVSVTVIGLVVASAQPMTMAWRFATFWQAALVVAILAAVSTGLAFAWNPSVGSSLDDFQV